MRSFGIATRVVLSLLFLMASTASWAEVEMKTRPGQGRLGNRKSAAKTRVASRSHLILDFAEVPTPATARELAARRMWVVGYLPATGLIVAIDGEANLDGLNVVGFDALSAGDKLSQELSAASQGDNRGTSPRTPRAFYIVEFHNDIPWDERRALIFESGAEIRDHRDLTGDHVLVRGTLEQMQALAEWDEIAYIFPASGELAAGLPLVGCLGGATDAGQVGQLTPRIGEGWDGPGLNRASLTYSMQGAVSPRLSEAPALSEIQRALAAWSAVVKVDFKQTANTSAAKNINILFGSRDHGDPYRFDGAGKALAHTFYPSLPNSEPLAGDLHFDNDENWNIGADIDLYSVALHELGHALGLGHSDVPNAVMYPYYRRVSGLTPEDIAAVRLLYAASSESLAPAPPPLAINFTSPAAPATTMAAVLTITGTLTGVSTSPAVNWQNGRGQSGFGVLTDEGGGTYRWQLISIPLGTGDNVITVTATDGANRSITRNIEVWREATVETPPVVPMPPTPPIPLAPTPSPSPIPIPTPVPIPSAALNLTVSSPAVESVFSTNTISAYGLVEGTIIQPTVRWISDRGFNGTAVITTANDSSYRWAITPIALLSGANRITVTATDSDNRSSIRTFRVTYKVDTSPGPAADVQPPRISITTPNTSFLMTTIYSLSVRGTASDVSGVSEVRWECSCGSQGIAQGTIQWTVPNISLPAGTHTIKINAKDPSGNEGTASFTVFRHEN